MTVQNAIEVKTPSVLKKNQLLEEARHSCIRSFSINVVFVKQRKIFLCLHYQGNVLAAVVFYI